MKNILVLMLFSVCSALMADDFVNSLETVKLLDEPMDPFVQNGYIVFTYKNPSMPYRVALAFEHEDYRYLKYYQINANGLYVLLYKPDTEKTLLKYRLVVDGIWMKDPFNSVCVKDGIGQDLSVIQIPKSITSASVSPQKQDNGRYFFEYTGVQGQNVYLCGDFCQWNPLLLKMKEKDPGVFSITVSLSPGQHFYYFVVDGQTMHDPFNPSQAFDNMGQRINFVQVISSLN